MNYAGLNSYKHQLLKAAGKLSLHNKLSREKISAIPKFS